MACLRLLVLALLAVSAAAAPQLLSEQLDGLLGLAQDDPLAAFQSYVALMGREYSPEEHAGRAATFAENVRKIAAHNARTDVSYTLGINAFADWTTEEFKLRYFGEKPSDLLELRAQQEAEAQSLEEALEGSHPFPYSHEEPPEAMDWREHGIIGPIKNQHANGSACGCCFAFGAVAGIEAANSLYTGEVVTLSEQEIVDCDDTDFGCEGGDFSNVVKWVKKHGIDGDDDYPYVAHEDKCNRRAMRRDVAVTVDGITHVPKRNESALQQAVAHTPTITAVCCGQFLDQWHLYKTGIFDETAHCAKPLDHSVLVVGYGATEDGSQYWVIKNSWGAEWGDQGFMKLKRNVADKHGQNGLSTMPGFAVKTHDNPDTAAMGRRGAKGGPASGVLSMLSSWVQPLQ